MDYQIRQSNLPVSPHGDPEPQRGLSSSGSAAVVHPSSSPPTLGLSLIQSQQVMLTVDETAFSFAPRRLCGWRTQEPWSVGKAPAAGLGLLAVHVSKRPSWELLQESQLGYPELTAPPHTRAPATSSPLRKEWETQQLPEGPRDETAEPLGRALR